MQFKDIQVGSTYAASVGSKQSWTIINKGENCFTYIHHTVGEADEPPRVAKWATAYTSWVLVKRAKIYPKRRAV